MRFYVLVAVAFVVGFFGTTWAARIPVTMSFDLLPAASEPSAGKPATDGDPGPGQLLAAAIRATRAFNEMPCDAERKIELIRTVSALKRLELRIDSCREGGCDEATRKKAVALLMNLPRYTQLSQALTEAYQSGGITEADFAGVTGIQYHGQDRPAAILDCTPGSPTRSGK